MNKKLVTRGMINSGILGVVFFTQTITSFGTGHEIIGIISVLAMISSIHDAFTFYNTLGETKNG